MMVATLSTGPVGPSDKLGSENKTNIMATCTADGKILKPSVPATAIDATFAQRAFGTGGPQGELWSAWSDLGAYRWHSVLSASIDDAFTVLPNMLKGFNSRHRGPSDPPAPAAYYKYQYGTDFTGAAQFDNLSLPANDKTTAQLWSIAPDFPSGHALLGEHAKFVPVSPVRFQDLQASSNGFSVEVKGRSGEQLSVRIRVPSGSVQSVACTLPASGNAVLRVPQMSCE